MVSTGYLRDAKEDDVPRLLELEAALFDNSLSETLLLHELELGYGLVFCGDTDGSILGYALVRVEGDLRDLTRLGVDPAVQGTGVGQFLLRAVTHGQAPGEETDVILTVKKANRRALRMYLRHGFAVVGHVSDAAAWALRWTAARASGAGPSGGPPPASPADGRPSTP